METIFLGFSPKSLLFTANIPPTFYICYFLPSVSPLSFTLTSSLLAASLTPYTAPPMCTLTPNSSLAQ